MIVATEALLAEHPNPTEQQIRVHLTGNICRCTGYSSIVASVQDTAWRLARFGGSAAQPVG
jgi:carbon-monoxide dehydrogenase small subunit